MSYHGPRQRGGGFQNSNTNNSGNNNNHTNNNHPYRGGVHKRRGGGGRYDSDGESGGGGGRGRGARGRGGADQTRGGRGRGQPAYQRGTFSGKGRKTWQQLSVSGLKESKASIDPDGGKKSLVTFLERKVNASNKNFNTHRKIKQSRMEGDLLIISLEPEDAPHFLKCNGLPFAGTSLVIEEHQSDQPGQPEQIDTDLSQIPQWIMDTLEDVITRRYAADQKLLNFAELALDIVPVAGGFFTQPHTAPKFFPALLRTANKRYKSAQAKRDGVVSVLLSKNELNDLSLVKDLAMVFPDIKNLDLSNNKFPDLRSLEAWRWKFRNLEHLILSLNPLEANVPDYKDQILKWYPTLRMLNGQQARSDAELKALAEQLAFAAEGSIPIPIKPGRFQDVGGVGQKFLTEFFPHYDNNRDALLNAYYDDRSTFSYAVNLSAPRSSMYQNKQVSYDAYIKGSRNLKRLGNPQGRTQRLHIGRQDIANCWATLPVTRHLDLNTMHNRWMIECHMVPGQVDVTGATPGGVNGILITVHSEFDEVNVATGESTETRSFDRTFVLGPSAMPGGIRVVSDMLTLRAYGGFDAFIAQESTPGVMVQEVDMSAHTNMQYLPPNLQPTISPIIPDYIGTVRQGASVDQVEMEAMVVAFSRRTTMTLEYSNMCLQENNWDMEAAFTAFEEVKDKLPREAWP